MRRAWIIASMMIGCHHAAQVAVVAAPPPKPHDEAPKAIVDAPVVIKPPPPGERTILPEAAAPATVNYCMEEFVTGTSGFWTPSVDQARDADDELARGLTELGSDIAKYNRQYTGVVVANKRKLVYVSAASVYEMSIFETNFARERFDWHRDPWGVCDGGAAFFQGAYDPCEEEVRRLHVRRSVRRPGVQAVRGRVRSHERWVRADDRDRARTEVATRSGREREGVRCGTNPPGWALQPPDVRALRGRRVSADRR
jgi:hypothetical protein